MSESPVSAVRPAGGSQSASESAQAASDRKTGFLCVGLATALFATSPILIRWAAPLSAYEITFWRMAVATATVGLLARVSGERIVVGRNDLPRFVLFGLVTALHFLLYAASLDFTTIAHSLSLVYTAPVFVTVFSAWLLRESVPRRKYVGIAAVVAGVAVLAGFEPAMDGRMLLGDALALGSAIAFGFYSVIGRSQRKAFSLFTYAAGTYGMAALWLLPSAAFSWTGAYSVTSVLSVLALGVLPLGVGHTLYNAALRRLHPTYVNLVATQELTGGVLLGALLLGEAPGVAAIVGAAVTLMGIVMVLL